MADKIFNLRHSTAMGQGILDKMQVSLERPVQYSLVLDGKRHPLNSLIGKKLCLEFKNERFCQNCSEVWKKLYNGGYCFNCSQQLACADLCIVRPELCHFDNGTCREEDWAKKHCFVSTIVYLANSSGVKVGITRESQIPTRWIDQGAIQGLPILKVKDRKTAGLCEVLFRDYVADKTNWRKMLKMGEEFISLTEFRDELFEQACEGIDGLENELGMDALELLEDESETFIYYPVQKIPDKLKSLSFDTQETIEGTLWGIKGQYLIMDSGVLNIRKFIGYKVYLK